MHQTTERFSAHPASSVMLCTLNRHGLVEGAKMPLTWNCYGALQSEQSRCSSIGIFIVGICMHSPNFLLVFGCVDDCATRVKQHRYKNQCVIGRSTRFIPISATAAMLEPSLTSRRDFVKFRALHTFGQRDWNFLGVSSNCPPFCDIETI